MSTDKTGIGIPMPGFHSPGNYIIEKRGEWIDITVPREVTLSKVEEGGDMVETIIESTYNIEGGSRVDFLNLVTIMTYIKNYPDIEKGDIFCIRHMDILEDKIVIRGVTVKYSYMTPNTMTSTAQ